MKNSILRSLGVFILGSWVRDMMADGHSKVEKLTRGDLRSKNLSGRYKCVI